ncbi:hypothetical protein ASG25_11315 [Rhizobium sp. Leaf384]|uniref:hypothetical protein n=1 Tax=unclassified Rhizobium TaxID=2613769 RepID=UPI000714BCFA|nr:MULTISPECIES: hypothetical protein [unclassified Rhizobium]KQR68744.1 hypothetical protein ASG03_05635 [Rhizobium sp. Leaf341]KQS79153.1 hypothetical protein ASG25_11315 [Rhizobium sp. Leaf384]KQS82721.1 hypothetical protein ASG58_05130 [Rhizobium sp. Leaf383]
MNPACLSSIAAAIAALLSGCQSAPAPAPVRNVAALPTMERIALSANACWFKSGDAAFKPYRLAPELNSFSGRPRILLVKRNNPEARPLAVIQAEGHPAKVDAFGPLFNEPIGVRMTGDVKRWMNGDKGC